MRRFVKFLASTAYIGYFPFAPGTAASATVLGCIWASGEGTAVWWALGTLVLGLMIAKAAVTAFGEGDPKAFVLDEWCGMALTMVGLPHNPAFFIGGFFLFRTFDVLKPCGIRRLDRMSHPFGIVLDDVLAGLYSNLVLQGVWRLVLNPSS